MLRPGVFVLATKNERVAQFIAGLDGATPVADPLNFRLWTDDYSNPFGILRW
jgi:hypothetical protein